MSAAINIRQVLAVLLLALAASVVSIEPAGAQCRPGDVIVSQWRTETTIETVCMNSAWVAPRNTLCQALSLVHADQNAIRALNFRASVETFEYFESLSAEQKAELEEEALDTLIGAGLDLSADAFDRVSRLNPFNVNEAIRRLRTTGLEDPALFGAMRRVAATRGKPELAREYRDLLEEIDRTRTVHDTLAEDDNQALRWALAALYIAQRNPSLDLVVTTAEFGENAAYLYYLTQQTGELTRQTEANLLTLNQHTARLRQHVAALRGARAQWRRTAGSADPQCS